MFRPSTEDQDLVIIGGGAAATAGLIEIINEFERRQSHGAQGQYSITIIERSAIAGAGYPYDPAHHQSTLKVNDANPGMQLSKDQDKLNDFVEWLQERGEALKKTYPELAQTIDDNNSGKERYAPRMIFGIYCRERFNHYLEKARKLGIKVNVATHTELMSAEKFNRDWILIAKENNKIFFAKNILVATGHLPSRKFTHLEFKPLYFDSPYSDLSKIPDEPIFILGSGLSAIDTIKLLALNKNHRAPVYMISPSGQLPRIKGPKAPEGIAPYTMKFLTRDNLDHKDLTLREILDLFVKELRVSTQNDTLDLETIMREVRQENKDPLIELNKEIQLVESNTLRGWQRMLGETWYEPLPLIWKNMADADRQEFISVYFPFYMKWAAGMTLSNAKEVAEFAATGRLHIIKSTAAVSFDSTTNQYSIMTQEQGEIHARTAINATGMGYEINNNPLLNAMAQRGHIRQAKFIGGVDITPDFRLIRKTGVIHENAWSIGVITFGCNLGSNSIEIAAIDAKTIAPQIVEQITKQLSDSYAA